MKIKIKLGYLLLPALIMLLATSYYFIFVYNFDKFREYRIGMLFSTKGQLASSEIPIIKALKLAKREINRQGGINGRKIKLVLANPGTTQQSHAWLMEHLLTDSHVDAVFACWTSACRKEVKPVVEKHNALMIYPNQYEGVEESQNIIYLGATPNQQIIPAVKWMMDHFGNRAYLIGSDYIFPHVANEIITKQLESLGGEVVGTSYIPLKSKNINKAVSEIQRLKPNVIINTINGQANIDFFNALFKDNASQTPVMSFSLTSGEIPKISPKAYPYMYSSWTYFQNMQNRKNKAFLSKYKKAYHSTDDVNDPAVSAYAAMFLLKQAVSESPNIKPLVVKDKLLRQSIASPAGVIYIDPYTSHSWRTVLIGKLNQQGRYNTEWSSLSPIRPVVYPRFKSKIQWEFFVYQLYLKWNKTWGNNYE